MSKTFSIITPSYNQVKYIDATIESILNQEGDFYIDYIINDGGSNDGAVDRIKYYEELLKANCDTKEINGLTYYVNPKPGFEFNKCLGISYRWKSGKDNGQSDAINQGFKMAKGDITTWMNTDDQYFPGIFQAVADEFKNNDIDALVGDTIGVDAEGNELWKQQPDCPSLFSLLYIQITPQQPGIFYTKELIDRVGGVDESLHYVMDVDLWIRFCFAGARFKKLYRMVATQIYHDASKSSQGDKMFELFKPEDRMIKRKYRARLSLQRRIWFPIKAVKAKVWGRMYVWGKNNLPRPVKNIINKLIEWKHKLTH
jgi:glycosyltransferase involved in cell wall biosynthesis